MDSPHQLAIQIVLDVLATRGGDGTTPFRMFTADIGEHRASLAKRFDRLVPLGTGSADVERVAAGIAPLIAAAAAARSS